jgi:hypothetical protein
LVVLPPSYDITQQLLQKDYGIELCKHKIEQRMASAVGVLFEGTMQRVRHVLPMLAMAMGVG